LTPGLAQHVVDYLKGLGFSVISFSNADRSDYAATVLVDYSGKANTVNALARRFNVSQDNIRHLTSKPGDVDVRVILGKDYVDTAQ
jgi:hypothetical protein